MNASDPPDYNPEADWEATGGATYDAALFALQAELPRIARTAQGQVGTREYKYPPYDKILAKVRPILTKHQFVWRTRPTLTVINREIRFVLAYSMTHLPSGEKDAGYWPLTEGPAQREGSDVSYAKRYALGAVLDLVVTGEDNDSAPEQEHEPEPRAQANGRSPTAQRPAKPKATKTTPAGLIAMHFDRFGITDRDERLIKTTILAEHEEPITSTNDLSTETQKRILAELSKCRDREALDKLLRERVPAA